MSGVAEKYSKRIQARIEQSSWTHEQYKAALEALAANEGACNGAGVSIAMHRAYCAWLHKAGTDEANKCAPVQLMLHQLVFLAGGDARFGQESDSSLDWYNRTVDECKRIVSEYEARELKNGQEEDQ